MKLNKTFARRAVYFASLILGGAGLCVAYGYFIEPHRLNINKQTIRIENLDPAFDKLKIVALSDIHGGSNGVTAERLREIVAEINRQDADLVVFLGDYVSQAVPDHTVLNMPIAEIAANLRGIKAKHGVFAVLGNHDHWYSDEEVRKHLTEAGMTVLDNEVAVIEKNDSSLRLLGLKDHMKIDSLEKFADDARKILDESEASGDVIVLEHSPDVLPVITSDRLISKDLKLMLAGHTHGGQVWFPLLGSLVVPSTYGQKYAAGHIKDAGLDMFVTTGIGTSILPFRFLVPPEIAVLIIETAK